MNAISFSNLLVVTAAAFAAPLLLGAFPRLKLPSVVLELLLGIVIGPSVLALARPDPAVQTLAVIGLGFLLFLAGLDVETERLRGVLLRLAGTGFAFSLGLSVLVSFGLLLGGQVHNPLFIAIVLLATSSGLVASILGDAGQIESDFGQLVLAGATAADFGTIILLSLFFSGHGAGLPAQIVLLGSFAALVVTAGVALGRADRVRGLSGLLVRLQDTTAQIRVRSAVLLLVAFSALAERFGLEVILGAFMAGVVLRAVDRDAMTHPHFRSKLDGIGYGFLIPIFYVVSGMQFDLSALLSSTSAILLVPAFVLLILFVRGVPAVIYRSALGSRRAVAAGLLQATTLSFIVAATAIGIALDQITRTTGAALVGAGLLSVTIFPALALVTLSGTKATAPQPT